jgi:hypothetical protein
MGLDDAFFFGALIFVGLSALIWLAKAPPRPAEPEPAPDRAALDARDMSEQPY